MKRTGLLFTLLGLIIVILFIVQISISNMLSVGGIRLSRIEQEILDTKRENAILKETVLDYASLTNISDKAEIKGFAPDKNVAVVVTRDTPPLALR